MKGYFITFSACVLFAILIIASIRIDLVNQQILDNGKIIKVYLSGSELESCKTSKKGTTRHIKVFYAHKGKNIKMLINKIECRGLNSINTLAKYYGGEYCIHVSFHVNKSILILKFCGATFLLIYSGITFRKIIR